MKYGDRAKGVLFIDRVSSTCGSCGRGCDPHEPVHSKLMGYNVPSGSEGCGAEFTKVSSTYTNMRERVTEMRPDLEYLDYWGEYQETALD